MTILFRSPASFPGPHISDDFSVPQPVLAKVIISPSDAFVCIGDIGAL